MATAEEKAVAAGGQTSVCSAATVAQGMAAAEEKAVAAGGQSPTGLDPDTQVAMAEGRAETTAHHMAGTHCPASHANWQAQTVAVAALAAATGGYQAR